MAIARSKADSVVWTDDEVELLLRVCLDYKASQFQENIDWESCQSKYTDILEAFQQQYPSSETTGGKEFPHEKDSISKVQVTSKLKAIRGKYRHAVHSGRRSGHGRVVLMFYELCEEIWGGSPATSTIEAGIESADMQVDPEDSSASNTRASTPVSDSLDPPSDETVGRNPPPGVIKIRRDMLQAKLNSHRGDRLKRKLHMDPAVQEDLQIKRRMMDLLEESERRNTDRLDKISDNIATITNTIREGFSLMRHFMSQPQPHGSSSDGYGHMQGFMHTPQHSSHAPGFMHTPQHSSHAPGPPRKGSVYSHRRSLLQDPPLLPVCIEAVPHLPVCKEEVLQLPVCKEEVLQLPVCKEEVPSEQQHNE